MLQCSVQLRVVGVVEGHTVLLPCVNIDYDKTLKGEKQSVIFSIYILIN